MVNCNICKKEKATRQLNQIFYCEKCYDKEIEKMMNTLYSICLDWVRTDRIEEEDNTNDILDKIKKKFKLKKIEY